MVLKYEPLSSGMSIKHSISDAGLAKKWEEICWKDYEKIRNDFQRHLSIASMNKDDELLTILTEKFLSSFEVRAVAVRNVTRNEATDNPGVGEPWTTPADFMKGAMILSHHNYESEPFYSFVMFEPKTKKNREMCIPSFYDRAMHDLFRMLLAPIVEPLYDLRLFSSREGRSLQDAVVEVCNIFSGPGAPEYVIRCDVKSFYDSMDHSWLLAHVPMDSRILSQFLNPGRIRDGKGPIQYCEYGVPTGNRLSPILANLILNGLEDFIADPEDSLNGVVVRWVDDFVISATSYEEAARMRSRVESFLYVRGLVLNKEKSYISHVSEGFEFLKFQFRCIGDRMDISPSEHAIDDEKEQLQEAVNKSKSGEQLVTNINNLVRGFATKYRISDITGCAVELDDAVLKMAILKISRIMNITNAEAVDRYLKKDDRGRNRFVLEDGSMIRYFMDIERVPHERVWLTANPYVDTEYFSERKKRLDIIKHVGRSPDYWNECNGRCAICGLNIFYYQDRRIAEDIDGSKAYIHSSCWEGSFFLEGRKRFRFDRLTAKLKRIGQGTGSDSEPGIAPVGTGAAESENAISETVDEQISCIRPELATLESFDDAPMAISTSEETTPNNNVDPTLERISHDQENIGNDSAEQSAYVTEHVEAPVFTQPHEIEHFPPEPENRVIIHVKRRTSVFQSLVDYLCGLDVSYITIKFQAVDQIMGGRLCNCAKRSKAWWYKTDKYSIKHALALIGWRVGKVDIKAQEVRFIHNLIPKSQYSKSEEAYMSRRVTTTSE